MSRNDSKYGQNKSRGSKGYFLDTDNICNFNISSTKEFLNDFNKDEDMVYIFYTLESHLAKAKDTLKESVGLPEANRVLVKCTPGKDSLDKSLISWLGKYSHTKYIIVSDDKGFDYACKDRRDVERRGISSKANVCSEIHYLDLSKQKLSKLDQLAGKYVVMVVTSSNRIMYYFDKSINIENRDWTYFLDCAKPFNSPKDTEEVLAVNTNALVVYVTSHMIDKARKGIYEWFFNSVNTL